MFRTSFCLSFSRLWRFSADAITLINTITPKYYCCRVSATLYSLLAQTTVTGVRETIEWVLPKHLNHCLCLWQGNDQTFGKKQTCLFWTHACDTLYAKTNTVRPDSARNAHPVPGTRIHHYDICSPVQMHLCCHPSVHVPLSSNEHLIVLFTRALQRALDYNYIHS